MSAATLLSDAPPAPTTSTITPEPPSSLSVVQNAEAAAATKTWVDQIQDPDLKSYATVKQWKDPADVLLGYRNLEKLLGGEKIPMPKGETDTEGWERVYKAIGRPETPEGYKIPGAETGDKTFLTEAAKVFHQAGLSNKQASELATWYQKYGSTVQQVQQEVIAKRNAQELEEFKRDAGATFDQKLELGKRAAKQFGFSNEELLAFENQFGTKALLTRFATIGEKLGEHVVTGDGPVGFGLSATSAAAQIQQLKQDKEFSAKYLSGNLDAKTRMMNLQAAAAGMTLEEYQKTVTGPGRG